jgi:putative oxidoreductase
MAETWNRLSPVTLSLLRIVAGFLLLLRGLQKLFGWFGGEPEPLYSSAWFAGALESMGGPLILLGLFTRPVALLLAAELLLTYLVAHAPLGFWTLRNGGEVTMLLLIVCLLLITAGAGKISIDQLFRRAPGWHNLLDRLGSPALILCRVLTGFLFWQHGAAKFGLLGGRVMEFPSLMWFAGVLEFFGGPLIALGIFTRPVALVLSGEMAYAFWGSHVPRGPSILPIENGGELAVLFCFLYLYLVTAGPGWLSLDRLLFKKSPAS